MEAQTIPLTPVTSSNISGIGYHAETQTLAVQFSTGLYFFAGVPADAAQAFRDADSKGKHFAAHIRGQYASVKQATPEPTPAPVPAPATHNGHDAPAGGFPLREPR